MIPLPVSQQSIAGTHSTPVQSASETKSAPAQKSGNRSVRLSRSMKQIIAVEDDTAPREHHEQHDQHDQHEQPEQHKQQRAQPRQPGHGDSGDASHALLPGSFKSTRGKGMPESPVSAASPKIPMLGQQRTHSLRPSVLGALVKNSAAVPSASSTRYASRSLVNADV